MGKINIDKYFKERVSAYSEDIDTDAIWNDLDLDEKKKDRGILFWLFGSMATIALLGIVYFGFFVAGQGTSKPTLKQAPVAHHSSNEHKENFETSPPAIDKTNPNEEVITKSDQWSEKPTSKIANEVLPNSNQQVLSQLLNSKKYNQPSKTTISSTQVIQVPIETTLNNLQSKQSISLSKGTDQKDFSILDLHRLPTIDRLEIKLLEYAFPIGNALDKIDELNIDPLIRKKTPSIDLDFYSSYNLAQRRLTTDYPEWLGEFIESKKETETTLDAIAVGTSIRYQFRSGLYAKLGVEALRITERFNHTIKSIENVIEDGLFKGTRPVTVRWVNFNHHNLLSLPSSIGYAQYRGRWSYFVEGSFQLNLRYRFSGLQLDLERNVTEEVVIDEVEIADTRPKHSYVLSVGVGYQLTPRSSLYLQPRFQSTFSTKRTSLEEFSAPISQHYNLYGVQLGLRYSLD